MNEGPSLDLTSLTDDQFRFWLDAYSNGYMHGLQVGGDQRDAEWETRFGRATQIVHAAAQWPDASREERMQRMVRAQRQIESRMEQVKKRPERGWAEPTSPPEPLEAAPPGEGDGQ